MLSPPRAPGVVVFSLCAGVIQVDKLVQLLESPIFLNLRLQLLDVDSPSYPALLKSLYGILMLLPQVTTTGVSWCGRIVAGGVGALAFFVVCCCAVEP